MNILLVTVVFAQLSFAEFHKYNDAIHDLESDKYQKRIEATNILRRAKERAHPILFTNRNKDEFTLEAKMRMNLVLKEYAETIVPSNDARMPWIDCLPVDYPNRDDVLKKYQPYKLEYADYTNEYNIYRENTQTFIIDLFISGTKTKAEIVELLDVMVKREKDWGWRSYDD